jgi:outer membrane protein assembly factor BamB
MPAMIGGIKQYLYSTLDGILGVSAKDGKLLWNHARKFNVAAVPSPLAIDGERIFATGPYDAGSIMIRVRRTGESFRSEPVFDFKNNEWNSEVHTPVIFNNHFFAVGKKRRGLFTCLNFDGKVVWDSDGKAAFELGSFLLADGMFFILEGKTGMLRLAEANTTGYKELAGAQVLNGQDVWGPMALSDGKLVLRDLTKMVCLDVRGK